MPKINLNTAELVAEKEELSTFLSRPDAFNDPDYSKKNRRFTELDDLIAVANRRTAVEQQIGEAKELLGGGDELADLAKEELPLLEKELEQLDEKLFIMLTPKDPNDEKKCHHRNSSGCGRRRSFAFCGRALPHVSSLVRSAWLQDRAHERKRE